MKRSFASGMAVSALLALSTGGAAAQSAVAAQSPGGAQGSTGGQTSSGVQTPSGTGVSPTTTPQTGSATQTLNPALPTATDEVEQRKSDKQMSICKGC